MKASSEKRKKHLKDYLALQRIATLSGAINRFNNNNNNNNNKGEQKPTGDIDGEQKPTGDTKSRLIESNKIQLANMFASTKNKISNKLKNISCKLEKQTKTKKTKITTTNYIRHNTYDIRSTIDCSFYLKHGYCNNNKKNSCKFTHNSSKINACKTFLLTGKCTNKSCLLSHDVPNNTNITPHCSFFNNHISRFREDDSQNSLQNFIGCKKGDLCKFLHVKLSKDAKVCDEFTNFGYCTTGEKCKMLHIIHNEHL